MPSSPTSPPQQRKIVETLSADRERYLSFVRRRVRSPEAAEDILQLGLTRAFERAGTLREMGALEGWFFQILRNVIIDESRKKVTQEKARAGLTLESKDFEEARERDVSACVCVGEAKDTLKPEYAQILHDVEVEGLAVKAFAERHGLTASAAGVRVHRARKALLDKVQKTCGACASEGCMDCTCRRSDSGCNH